MNIGECLSELLPVPPGTNVSVYLDLVGTSVSVKVNYTCMDNTSLTQLITCDEASQSWPSVSVQCYTCPLDPPAHTSSWQEWNGLKSDGANVTYTCMGNTSLTQLITCDGTSNTWQPSLSLDCPPVIASPNFPDNYDTNEEFERLIEVPKGKIIYIQFTHFNIELIEHPSDPCHYDWVMIIDGNGTELLPKSCGVDIPGDVVSLTNKVTVKFSSDQYGTRRSGFRLIYAETGEIIIC